MQCCDKITKGAFQVIVFIINLLTEYIVLLDASIGILKS